MSQCPGAVAMLNSRSILPESLGRISLWTLRKPVHSESLTQAKDLLSPETG
jgi:hypothetical protein